MAFLLHYHNSAYQCNSIKPLYKYRSFILNDPTLL